MKKCYILFILFTICPLLFSCGRYAEMKTGLENYEPPVSPVQMKEISSEEKESGKDQADSDVQIQQLQEMKDTWNRSLSLEKSESSFVRLSPALIKKFRSASDDPDVSARILSKGYTLNTLETLTLLRNPGIRAAERKVRAEAEAFSQVAYLDEILRQYTAFTAGLMNGIGPMKGKDAIQMKYPFPGITALKGRIVNRSVAAAREDLEIARREAVTTIRKTYWNLLFIQKSRQIMAETLELFRRLESVADTRYRAGNAGFQDVIKVTIRSRIMEEDLHTLAENEKNLKAKILEMVNLPPDTPVGFPSEKNPGRNLPVLEKLYRSAKEKRQELRKMRAMVGKMEGMVEMAETMILPPFTLNFSLYDNESVLQAGSAAMKPSFPITTASSMGAGLPQKPWFGSTNAWLGQTRQNLAALREELQKAESATDNMVRNAWSELDKAVREYHLYHDTIKDLSRSALDVSTKGYESGSVSFADVIASYTDWLNTGLALVRKNSDIGVARAELERVTGRSF